jgi:hypothetical protein
MKQLSAFSLQQKPLFIAGAFNSAPFLPISNNRYYQKNPGGERVAAVSWRAGLTDSRQASLNPDLKVPFVGRVLRAKNGA